MTQIRLPRAGVVVLLASLCTALLVLPARASAAQRPYRVSDKQVERLLDRIEKGSDRFKDSLHDALNDSRLDDTRREDDINRFVSEFENSADRLKDDFKDDRSTADNVREVLSRATAIDRFMNRVRFNSRTQKDWRSLKSDLDQLARAYRVGWDWRRSTN
jgi:hypothetical protein